MYRRLSCKMPKKEWTWYSLLGVLVGAWLIAGLVFLSSCLGTVQVVPEDCYYLTYTTPRCEYDHVWVNGHYWYRRGQMRWTDGRYFRRPGYPRIDIRDHR